MADHDVKIRIGEEGAEETVGAIASISKAFHAISAPLLKVRNAAAALFKTLGTVSFVIHGIALVVDSVKRLHDWMESSRAAAAEMANARLMDRFSDSLNKATERAKRLKEETAETLENLKELQRRKTAERESDKAVKGASLNLEEQRALSGVTDADERQRISDDFRLRRADLDASGKAREANDTRRAINSQINAALDSLGREERYRTAREPDRERMYRAWLNWRPADSKGREEFAKRQEEIRSENPSLSDSAVREKALGQMEEAKKRKAALDKMDEEIAASDARTKELNKLVDSLKHERALLDKSVQNSELQRQAVYQEVANAQADRKRQRDKERSSADREARRRIEDANAKLEAQRALGGATEDERQKRISENEELRSAENAWRRADEDANAETDPIKQQAAKARAEAAKVEYEAARQKIENARAERDRDRRAKIDEANLNLQEQRALGAAENLRGANVSGMVREELKRQISEDADLKRAEDKWKRTGSEEDRIDYEAARQKIENARAERDRERERESVTREPAILAASDRITAMGGFATAGAAAISGIAAGPDRTYQELRAQKDLLKQEIEQLKKIVRNTEDAGATFQ